MNPLSFITHVVCLSTLSVSLIHAATPIITKKDFGSADGLPNMLYTLYNTHGMSVSIMNYDARVLNLMVPDAIEYGHNYAVNGYGLREIAEMEAPKSGRVMTVSSDQPGLRSTRVASSTARSLAETARLACSTARFAGTATFPRFTQQPKVSSEQTEVEQNRSFDHRIRSPQPSADPSQLIHHSYDILAFIR